MRLQNETISLARLVLPDETFINIQNLTIHSLDFLPRFLSSSKHATIRAWSNLRTVTRAILVTTILIGLVYIYVPLEYEIQPVGSLRCPASQGKHAIFYGVWSLIIFSLSPSMVMMIFGTLTIRNVRRSLAIATVAQGSNTMSRQTGPSNHPNERRKNIDRQLIRMMICQSVYFSILATPVSIHYIYTRIRASMNLEPLQRTIDEIFGNLAGILSFTAACTTFYVFTLASPLFRQELLRKFKCCAREIGDTTRTLPSHATY